VPLLPPAPGSCAAPPAPPPPDTHANAVSLGGRQLPVQQTDVPCGDTSSGQQWSHTVRTAASPSSCCRRSRRARTVCSAFFRMVEAYVAPCRTASSAQREAPPCIRQISCEARCMVDPGFSAGRDLDSPCLVLSASLRSLSCSSYRSFSSASNRPFSCSPSSREISGAVLLLYVFAGACICPISAVHARDCCTVCSPTACAPAQQRDSSARSPA
jgi:hypothetical protein